MIHKLLLVSRTFWRNLCTTCRVICSTCSNLKPHISVLSVAKELIAGFYFTYIYTRLWEAAILMCNANHVKNRTALNRRIYFVSHRMFYLFCMHQLQYHLFASPRVTFLGVWHLAFILYGWQHIVVYSLCHVYYYSHSNQEIFLLIRYGLHAIVVVEYMSMLRTLLCM